jgi:isopentenyl diphosphate isomerase/L-lactate dehydrogenase-like FMN-dependent dehydrogenase
VLKGLLHPDDAALAIEHGADGVIVSNHGGRQVNGAVGALRALPRIVERVDGRIPVLFDSGIRRGSDALKALALGAEAVLLGRPYLYGLALGGEEGVSAVVENFRADLDLTLALTGNTAVTDIDRSVLAPADWFE